MNSTTTFWYALLVFAISVCGWALSSDMQFSTQHMNIYIAITVGILLVASASQLGNDNLELMQG
jgi:hypothetical protein